MELLSLTAGMLSTYCAHEDTVLLIREYQSKQRIMEGTFCAGLERRPLEAGLVPRTSDTLSMRWEAPPAGAALYVVELAEADGDTVDDEDWCDV